MFHAMCLLRSEVKTQYVLAVLTCGDSLSFVYTLVGKCVKEALRHCFVLYFVFEYTHICPLVLR